MTEKTLTRRNILLLGGISALLPMFGVAAAGRHPQTALDGISMGTYYRVTLARPRPNVDIAELHKRIRLELANIDRRMSLFRTDSELVRFNQLSAGRSLMVSPETFYVANQAFETARLTGGTFDPMAGARNMDWNKGAVHSSIILDPNSNRLVKTETETSLDFNGIAKGYGLDRVAALLKSVGLSNFLIEFGGEVLAQGNAPNGASWSVAIENPIDPVVASIIVQLNGKALATSGDYRNFFTFGGRRFAHVINPATGKPAQHGTALVAVIADTAIEADALATGMMAMPPRRVLALAKSHKIPMVLFVRATRGLKEIASPAFAAHRLA